MSRYHSYHTMTKRTRSQMEAGPKNIKVYNKRNAQAVQTPNKKSKTVLSLVDYFPLEILFHLLAFIQPKDIVNILATCKMLNWCIRNMMFQCLDLTAIDISKFRLAFSLRTASLKINGPQWLPALRDSEDLEELTIVQSRKRYIQLSRPLFSNLNLSMPKLRVLKIKNRPMRYEMLQCLANLKTLEKLDLFISLRHLEENTSNILEAWTKLMKNNAKTLKHVRLHTITGTMLNSLFEHCPNLETLKVMFLLRTHESNFWETIKNSKLKKLEYGHVSHIDRTLSYLPSSLKVLKLQAWAFPDKPEQCPNNLLHCIQHPSLSQIEFKIYANTSMKKMNNIEIRDIKDMKLHVKQHLPGLLSIRRVWMNDRDSVIASFNYPATWLRM